MALSSLKNRHKLLVTAISALIILSFIGKLINITYIYLTTNFNISFSLSELLINFEGGFVRRGLIGELLLKFYNLTGLPIKETILILCYLAFFCVIIYFFRQFYKKKYCWWLILSPLFLGNPFDIVRKDYLLYIILITTLYFLYKNYPSLIKKSVACVLVVLGLFIHEAFIFWGFPIYALLILSYNKHKLSNILLISIPLITFVILCIFKGDVTTAHAIVDSWNNSTGDNIVNYSIYNAIGAIGWKTTYAITLHLRANVANNFGGIIITPLILILSYYLFTNFLYVFKQTSAEGKLCISLLYSSIAICLIPMLTVLSCDTYRNVQYIAITTFATFLIIPHKKIISLYPRKYINLIERFNNRLAQILVPNKTLLVILLIFLSISLYSFNINQLWNTSIIGFILKNITPAAKYILSII